VVNLYIYEQAFRSLHFAEAAAMTVIVLAGTIVLTLGMLWGSKRLEELN
jgi:multiple sugar transport system permease protein